MSTLSTTELTKVRDALARALSGDDVNQLGRATGQAKGADGGNRESDQPEPDDLLAAGHVSFSPRLRREADCLAAGTMA